MKKLILLDLDGTLTNTTDIKYKSIRDGIIEVSPFSVPLIDGALDFVNELKNLGHTPAIVSDSHSKLVKKVAEEIFKVPFLSLAEKPNTLKTLDFIQKIQGQGSDISKNVIVIGDTWLDIALGRGLNCLTILFNYAKNRRSSEEVRQDGVGQIKRALKSGPSFCVKTYEETLKIIDNPNQHLLAAEAIFNGENTTRAVQFDTQFYEKGFFAVRALGRQEVGEADKFCVAPIYHEFQRPDRRQTTLELLAKSIENYIHGILTNYTKVKWDYLTYVTDKATTSPPNKMKELFDLIRCNVNKIELLEWSPKVNGSIKNQENYGARLKFVDDFLFLNLNENLDGKNIIIIDDQLTTGGTAQSIYNNLSKRGISNVLFITLFYLIDSINSNRTCPRCSKKLTIKINRTKGNKFYSCTPPAYKGDGCGYGEDIKEIQYAKV